MQIGKEKGRSAHVWVHRVVSLVAVPAIILLLSLVLGAVMFWVWLIVLASYIVLLSVLGIMNQPTACSERRIGLIVRLLGSFIWRGLLLLLYSLFYLIIFHYRDLMAHEG